VIWKTDIIAKTGKWEEKKFLLGVLSKDG